MLLGEDDAVSVCVWGDALGQDEVRGRLEGRVEVESDTSSFSSGCGGLFCTCTMKWTMRLVPARSNRLVAVLSCPVSIMVIPSTIRSLTLDRSKRLHPG